jgi:hypothetical protein
LWHVAEFNNIKSIQRGQYVHEGYTTTPVDVTISNVNSEKSIVICDQYREGSSYGPVSIGGAILINGTTLRFYGLSSDIISWQVIEFK